MWGMAPFFRLWKYYNSPRRIRQVGGWLFQDVKAVGGVQVLMWPRKQFARLRVGHDPSGPKPSQGKAIFKSHFHCLSQGSPLQLYFFLVWPQTDFACAFWRLTKTHERTAGQNWLPASFSNGLVSSYFPILGDQQTCCLCFDVSPFDFSDIGGKNASFPLRFFTLRDRQPGDGS